VADKDPGVSEKACPVCGHVLGPYLRICDKCGSIQRRSTTAGTQAVSVKMGTCRVCGIPVPPDETLCAKCYVVKFRKKKKGRSHKWKKRLQRLLPGSWQR